MSKIQEIIVEPNKIVVGSTFKLKVKVNAQEGGQNEEQNINKNI